MSPAWRWEATDRHRARSWLAVLGLAGGVALAVLGLPPVDWQGPLHQLGIIDPLCGATRGVRLTLRGDLVGAWQHNPAAPCWSPAPNSSCCAGSPGGPPGSG